MTDVAVSPAAPRGPFGGRVGVQGKGVDRTGEQVGEQPIHAPMALDAGQAGKGLGNQRDLEVGFGTRRHIVLAALVDDLEQRGMQCAVENLA